MAKTREAWCRVMLRSVTLIVLAGAIVLWAAGWEARGGEAVSERGVNVWAAGDGVRVDPETGRYLEDRTDLFPDYPTGEYRSRNPLWDAGKGRVSLHAARNEFVSFQFVVEPDGPVGRVSVHFDRRPPRRPLQGMVRPRHPALPQL